MALPILLINAIARLRQGSQITNYDPGDHLAWGSRGAPFYWECKNACYNVKGPLGSGLETVSRQKYLYRTDGATGVTWIPPKPGRNSKDVVSDVEIYYGCVELCDKSRTGTCGEFVNNHTSADITVGTPSRKRDGGTVVITVPPGMSQGETVANPWDGYKYEYVCDIPEDQRDTIGWTRGQCLDLCHATGTSDAGDEKACDDSCSKFITSSQKNQDGKG